MKRAVIFAHYDKDNLVDDYVVYYLQALRKIANTIVFVSCNDLSEKERLKTGADIIIAEPHREYDFGSYKRGVLALNTDDYDEIIFANDSCYGPLYSLEPIFEQMSNKTDFWGITCNKWFDSKVRPHIQSYFLVFGKKVFGELAGFLNSVKEEPEKKAVIEKYEIGLSEYLHAHGFSSDAAVKLYRNSFNAAIIHWRQILTQTPFVKCSVLRGINRVFCDIRDWEKSIPSGYPSELIKKNIERTGFRSQRTRPWLTPKIYYEIIKILPAPVVYFWARGYNFLRKRIRCVL